MSASSAPSTILFPWSGKVGYRDKNKVVIFSADSISIEEVIDLPFPVLFFSCPFEEHFILVVNSDNPTSVVLWNISAKTEEKTLQIGKNITNFVSFGTFSALVTESSVIIVRNRPLVIHHVTETKNAVRTLALAQSQTDANHCLLAIPDLDHPGNVIISSVPETSHPVCINAHKSDIACVALSYDGKFLATSSIKGTIVRLWDTNGQLLNENRRGWSPAGIVHLSFSPCNQYLCASSNHLTAHIFKVGKHQSGDTWILPKADVTVSLPSSSTVSSFVLGNGKSLCCVTDMGNCFVYDVDFASVSSKLRSSMMIPKLAKFSV